MGIGSMGGRSLDAAKIEAAYVGFFTTFQDRLQQTSPLHRELSIVTETENVLDTQLWLSNVPKMRKWIGPKQLGKLRGQSQPITTSPFEASIEVSKHDVLYDRLGIYKDRINSMADGYGWALDEMVIGAIAAGIAGTALGTTYDGQNLVDTDHTALATGGTQQTNKVTGALSATTYATAWQRFYQIKDENGNPLNVPGARMVLLVGPQNRQNARTILQQDIQAAGARNIDYGTADLVVHPRIDAGTIFVNGISVTLTGTEWALIPRGSAAILTQIRRSAEFLSVEEGEFAFRTGKYLYGIEAEFGFAYGLWQEIVGGPGV